MYLVFDIGGTNSKIAVSSDGKTLTQSKTIPTEKDFEQAVLTVEKIAKQLANGQKIQAVAGGLAGVLDAQKTMLIKSPHLSSWVNKSVKLKLAAVFQAEVKLENDVALAGLGEAYFGQFKDQKIIAYIAIGTGVGGVRIVDQKIDRNSLGFEPGHQIIVPDGRVCSCGGKGHLETYVSGAYLKEPINWDEVSRYLAVGLHNTIVHWSPNMIVLGGSVMKSIPLDKVKSYLNQYLTIFPACPEIVLAKLGDKGGLYGGLVKLMELQQES